MTPPHSPARSSGAIRCRPSVGSMPAAAGRCFRTVASSSATPRRRSACAAGRPCTSSIRYATAVPRRSATTTASAPVSSSARVAELREERRRIGGLIQLLRDVEEPARERLALVGPDRPARATPGTTWRPTPRAPRRRRGPTATRPVAGRARRGPRRAQSLQRRSPASRDHRRKRGTDPRAAPQTERSLGCGSIGVPSEVASCWSARQASLLGWTCPFSHRLTVEKVTLSACASPSCVSPTRPRHVANDLRPRLPAGRLEKVSMS